MRIECKQCHKYLGEIREGSQLRKGMVMLCGECNLLLQHRAGDKRGAASDFGDLIMNHIGRRG